MARGADDSSNDPVLRPFRIEIPDEALADLRHRIARVEVPTGCAAFPADIVVPSRRWVERCYPNVVHWTDMPRGGHFSGLEVPELLAADLRDFFRPLR